MQQRHVAAKRLPWQHAVPMLMLTATTVQLRHAGSQRLPLRHCGHNVCRSVAHTLERADAHVLFMLSRLHAAKTAYSR